MRLIPLKQWICDSCGQTIEKLEDAWFEYLKDINTHNVSGFRIAHHNMRCGYDDQTLKSQGKAVGAFVLKYMTSYGAFGHLLQWLELTQTGKIKGYIEITEFTEMMRRLYLPYWEEARLYWNRAFEDGFHDNTDFSEKTLKKIIEKFSQEQ